MKTCCDCKVEKPMSEFYQYGKKKPQKWCKPCNGLRTKKWLATKDENYRYRVTRRFGWKARGIPNFTVEDYENTFAAQGGCCACCKKDVVLYGAKGSPLTACVDHDHVTGRVRGLLCHNCNKGIGCLGDSIEGLKAALNYVTSPLGVPYA